MSIPYYEIYLNEIKDCNIVYDFRTTLICILDLNEFLKLSTYHQFGGAVLRLLESRNSDPNRANEFFGERWKLDLINKHLILDFGSHSDIAEEIYNKIKKNL